MQCNEQGLVACFGYPVAQEDAPRRAAGAGLRLLDEVKSLGTRRPPPHTRTRDPTPLGSGIHTGPAIVEVKEDAVSLVGDAPATSPFG